MTRIDQGFIKEIEKYGAFDTAACFNCGNCTAVCPLSKEDSIFPRRLIRYAHLGDKKRLLAAKEMWMCYYCGECSKTCPREAKPAAFMAAARRFAIANNDLTGVTKLLYKYSWFNALFMAVTAVILALFMYGQRLENRAGHKIIEIFNIPFAFIHDLGLGLMIVAGLTLAAGFLKMALEYADIRAVMPGIIESSKKVGFKWVLGAVKAAYDTVVLQMLAFKRFRECDAEKKDVHPLSKPWLLHALTAWGFMGLFLATVLDLLFKDPEMLVALWYPPRLIGTVSGLMLMYGTTRIIIERLKSKQVPYSNPVFTDWLFLVTLWFIGLTGFTLEILVYLPHMDQMTADILFLVHVAPAMQLVVLAAFTKLAHVFYRPFALFVHELKAQLQPAAK